MSAPELDDSVQGVKLLRLLEEQWAKLPADDDGEELALKFGRAAYARGYVEALEQPREQPRP